MSGCSHRLERADHRLRASIAPEEVVLGALGTLAPFVPKAVPSTFCVITTITQPFSGCDGAGFELDLECMEGVHGTGIDHLCLRTFVPEHLRGDCGAPEVTKSRYKSNGVREGDRRRGEDRL